MKIQIEIVPEIKENEVIIRCGQIDGTIARIQNTIAAITASQEKFIFYKEDTEYYLPLEKIIFFETGDNTIYAHTKKDVFQTKYKLYELENMLPQNFMRVSKSTILNINHIFSITRNLTASSKIEFEGTHKLVYVSRNYYKQLKSKLDEKRSLK